MNKVNEVLKFEIDKFELLETLNNEQLTKVRMYIVSEGNNRHNLIIPWESISMAKNSLVGKPILCAYSARNDKFLGHEPDEVPVGVFLRETEIYENVEFGKRWLVADAYIWKKYFNHIVEVFRKNDGKSNISMEIQVVETNKDELGKTEISAFLFMGVTLIGVEPAIENSRAEVLNFAEMVKETEKIVFSNHPLSEFLEGAENANTPTNSGTKGENIDSQNQSKEDEGMKDNEKMAADETEIKEEKMAEVEVEIKDGNEDDSSKGEVDCAKVACEKCGKMECECQKDMSADSVDYKVKCEEMEVKCSTLESEKVEIATKFSALETELASVKETNVALQSFKSNVEKQVRDNEIEFAIREVAEDIGQVNVDEWKAKVDEFESVESFKTAIESFAYSLTKGKKKKDDKKEDFSRIALVTNNVGNDEVQDCWTKLKNKITK